MTLDVYLIHISGICYQLCQLSHEMNLFVIPDLVYVLKSVSHLCLFPSKIGDFKNYLYTAISDNNSNASCNS